MPPPDSLLTIEPPSPTPSFPTPRSRSYSRSGSPAAGSKADSKSISRVPSPLSLSPVQSRRGSFSVDSGSSPSSSPFIPVVYHGQLYDLGPYQSRHPGGDFFHLLAYKDISLWFEAAHPLSRSAHKTLQSCRVRNTAKLSKAAQTDPDLVNFLSRPSHSSSSPKPLQINTHSGSLFPPLQVADAIEKPGELLASLTAKIIEVTHPADREFIEFSAELKQSGILPDLRLDLDTIPLIHHVSHILQQFWCNFHKLIFITVFYTLLHHWNLFSASMHPILPTVSTISGWTIFTGYVLQFFWMVHDCTHDAVGITDFSNDLLATAMTMIVFGFDPHCVGNEHKLHHSFTNVVGVDRATDVGPFALNSLMSQKEVTPLGHFIRRYQVIIWFILVPALNYPILLHQSIESIIRRREYIRFTLILIRWAFVFYYLPLTIWLPWILSCEIVGAIAAFFAVLNHYHLDMQDIQETIEKDESFVASMSKHVQNYPSYALVDWLSGGLTYHLEHHIFPSLNPRYLRGISNRTKEICQRHGLSYQQDSILEVMKRSIRALVANSEPIGSHVTPRSSFNTTSPDAKGSGLNTAASDQSESLKALDGNASWPTSSSYSSESAACDSAKPAMSRDSSLNDREKRPSSSPLSQRRRSLLVDVEPAPYNLMH